MLGTEVTRTIKTGQNRYIAKRKEAVVDGVEIPWVPAKHHDGVEGGTSSVTKGTYTATTGRKYFEEHQKKLVAKIRKDNKLLKTRSAWSGSVVTYEGDRCCRAARQPGTS